MTTVINNPSHGGEESSGMGMILGVIGALVLVVLFFVFILPEIRDTDTQNEPTTEIINVDLPAPTPDPEPAP